MPSLSKNGRIENTPADSDDAEAIRATLRGDRQAFARLVEKYQRPLYAMLRRLVRQHEDADDLLQECFLRAYQHLKEFEVSRPFYPWLYRIALNLALSSLRRRKWQQPMASLDLLPSGEEDPDQSIAAREFHVALERAIAKLPAEQRTILLLRTREDMSYQELSQTLGIEVGTVMSRLARAREKLRAWMRPHLEAVAK
ncbi:sigma-70 family RNA polymerase sigma factor [candidate division KSB1 bacterium]|nr:sigma-70 family RNA polymerase sigma factor [candidate division KSB1 bacterium]